MGKREEMVRPILFILVSLTILCGTVEIGMTVGFVDAETLTSFQGTLGASISKDPVGLVRFFPLYFALMLVWVPGQLVGTLVAALVASIMAILLLFADAWDLLKYLRLVWLARSQNLSGS